MKWRRRWCVQVHCTVTRLIEKWKFHPSNDSAWRDIARYQIFNLVLPSPTCQLFSVKEVRMDGKQLKTNRKHFDYVSIFSPFEIEMESGGSSVKWTTCYLTRCHCKWIIMFGSYNNLSNYSVNQVTFSCIERIATFKNASTLHCMYCCYQKAWVFSLNECFEHDVGLRFLLCAHISHCHRCFVSSNTTKFNAIWLNVYFICVGTMDGWRERVKLERTASHYCSCWSPFCKYGHSQMSEWFLLQQQERVEQRKWRWQ